VIAPLRSGREVNTDHSRCPALGGDRVGEPAAARPQLEHRRALEPLREPKSVGDQLYMPPRLALELPPIPRPRPEHRPGTVLILQPLEQLEIVLSRRVHLGGS
jgi:hypothetical protein